ncbi:MAG: DUF5709 domain-containing protein [Actinomycetota bacterium]|nr:DUF5709 domain-containing protein [Actinomycetota bacterium]
MTQMSDEVPEGNEQFDQLQPDDTLNDRGVVDTLDEGYSPPEAWSAAESFGSTAEEQRTGESLDQRIAQEVPERDPYSDEDDDYLDDGEVGTRRAGRLVESNSGSGEDVESELYGTDVGIDGAGSSAEEAAVHVIDDDY